MVTDFEVARAKALIEIADLVRLTVKALQIEQGKAKKRITKNKAGEKLGKTQVETWERLELIQGNKSGLSKTSPIYYDALEIEALSIPSNRATYVALIKEQEQQTNPK